MADPLTIALVAGTALNAAGSISQGQTAAFNAEARAEADRFNAEVARQRAESEEQATRGDIRDFRSRQSARLAASRASRAGGGIASLQGSPLLVDEAAAQEIEFGVQRIAGRGAQRAHRLRQRGSLLDVSARNERTNAGLSRTAGFLNAAGDVASGGVSMAKAGSFG